MKTTNKIQYRMRQRLYKPTKGKISMGQMSKDFNEIDSMISSGIGFILNRNKKESEDDENEKED